MLVFCSAQKGKKNDERVGVINQRKRSFNGNNSSKSLSGETWRKFKWCKMGVKLKKNDNAKQKGKNKEQKLYWYPGLFMAEQH